MASNHLIRKAIAICQTSALADSLTDGEIMSAIKYVYDTFESGARMNAHPEKDIAETHGNDSLFNS